MKLELCIPCLFGLEGLVGNELRHMQMENVRPENGRVYFTTDEEGLARANVRSRFGERVLLVMGRFSARTFDELFEGTKALPWERYIPKNGAFPVKGYSLDSALHSVPDCQKIIKKAVADRLAAKYHQPWLPEDGPLYQIQFAIMKDQAVLYLDTTGTGLFKRGYRPAHVAAPLRETLAAAMVDIAGYRGRGDFCDPFCGSGTIAIEAASTVISPQRNGTGWIRASGSRPLTRPGPGNSPASTISSPRTSTPKPWKWRKPMPSGPVWTIAFSSPWQTPPSSTGTPNGV